jgi:hypothetical protein
MKNKYKIYEKQREGMEEGLARDEPLQQCFLLSSSVIMLKSIEQ